MVVIVFTAQKKLVAMLIQIQLNNMITDKNKMAHKFNEARLFINYTKMNKLRSIIQRCNNGRIV